MASGMPTKQFFTPALVKNLRACLRCRLIQTKDQFFHQGCPTCADVLHMREDEGRVAGCTTPTFQGYVAIIRPGSFVSRFNGLDKRNPGLYALSVTGSIPEHILHESEYERDDALETRTGIPGSLGGRHSASMQAKVVRKETSPVFSDTDDEEDALPPTAGTASGSGSAGGAKRGLDTRLPSSVEKKARFEDFEPEQLVGTPVNLTPEGELEL
eukprot:TRINITY_DN70964_c0_g1_i1.p1 TRINITY_DN70964_c0_g1~~TRINITY_DN70964_c0_g1_i1.p1  ORF type:complete len:234 (-),score=26.83 TRINITY_DN70964_c0_g1_i1:116-754(-)